MGDEQYLSRIRQLESEIEYLHGLLDNAGISYKREAKELDDLSPDRNFAFEENQGARILPVTITKQHIQYFYHLFEYWIINKRFKSDGIVEQGYSAEKLASISEYMNEEGAFVLLVEIRENPEKALKRIGSRNLEPADQDSSVR